MPENSNDHSLYSKSIDPVATDGRDVDPNLGTLSGEGSRQLVRHDDRHLTAIAPSPWDQIPRITDTDTTYYDRPILKSSVWSIDIPLYYYVGGAAGAAMTLGAAMQLACHSGACPRDHFRKLSKGCHWIGIIGSTLGAALLIHDLGRPMRFFYMLRVFRPTSPMNMGAWILAVAAPGAIATGVLINQPGPLGIVGEISGYVSGLFGAALAGYTGVLVSGSVIPIWQESRRWMPVLFIASAAATAASVLDVAFEDTAARRVTQVFGTVARVAEIAASKRVEHLSSRVPKVGEPFRKGVPGMLWKAATVLTAASLAISLLPPLTSPKRARLAGILGAAGSLCLRFAVHYLSDASTSDPRAVFHQQRSPEGWSENRSESDEPKRAPVLQAG